MPLHVWSTCANHQEVKIALHSFWYHHAYRWSSRFTISLFHASTCFEDMCSKHVEAGNKLVVKQKFCASSWLITEINILRCTVSKTSKFGIKSRARSQWSNFRIPVEDRSEFLLQNVQNLLCPKQPRIQRVPGFFPGGKAAGGWGWPLTCN